MGRGGAAPQSREQEGLCRRVKGMFVALASSLPVKGVRRWMLEKSGPQPLPRSAKASLAPPAVGSGAQPTPLLACTAAGEHLEENADFSLWIY